MTEASAGSEYARTRDILAVFAALLVLTAVLVVVLVQAWPAPRITAVEPSSGPPGAPVTIRGTGLASATGVRFGAVRSPVAEATDTLVRTAVPAGATSGRPIVATPAGSATAPEPFTVE